MKKTNLILFSFLILITWIQCKNDSTDTLSSNADSRAKIISTLLNNDAYMNQVMDSMRTKHPDAILSTIFILAKNDKHMQEGMMDNMMDMCKVDTTTAKMVVTKTMHMLDDLKLDCCTTGRMMIGDAMTMNHADCCKKGKMSMGKTGEMSAVEKLTCCMMASKN